MDAPNPGPEAVIRTPDQRLRVFVSSTLKEMAGERAAVRTAVQRLHLAPVMFELGARPHPARELYRAYLAQSHIFIGLYASQYGWVAPGAGISGLEDEYRLAADKPKLIYIRGPGVEREPRLASLLSDIRDRDGVAYKYFSSAGELGELVEADLALMLAERFEAAGGGAVPGQERLPEEPEETGLPTLPTATVGREQELSSIRRMLFDQGVRCLTLTGAGGSGKTRLALEAARRLAGGLGRPVFVELAPITDPALVPDAVASALGIRQAGAASVEEQLLRHLRSLRRLIVLDNFEQVAAAAPFAARILERCPQVRLLVTSRMPLGIRGEQELIVPPLPLPPQGTLPPLEALARQEAVALFCERARAVRPEFRLTEENAASIVQICRRLDGLPLAIELAAPRIRLLTPEAMLARLEGSLALLSSSASDLPPRQRTMRSAIAWSYDLLDLEEAAVFRSLSVFAGGCTLSAAQAVARGAEGDPLPILEALVARNLLLQREDPSGEPRLHMLETVREFAREELAEENAEAGTLARHASWFASLGEEAEPWLTSGRRDPWISRLEIELDNLRAVLRRGLERRVDPLPAIRLAGSLGWFWHLRGHLSEGRRWATALADLPEAAGRTPARARVLFPAGGLAWSQGDYSACELRLGESADIFREIGDTRGLVQAEAILAGAVASLGDFGRAAALCEGAAALGRESGDRWGLAFVLLWHGDVILAGGGDPGEAAAMFGESLRIAMELADPWIRAEALNHLATAAAMQGDGDAALAFFDESLEFHRATGDRWAVARVLSGRAEIHLRRGEARRARELFAKSFRVWLEMGNRTGTQASLSGLARATAAEGDSIRAALLLGAAPEAVTPVGYLFLRGAPEKQGTLGDSLRRELGEEAFRREADRGAAMSMEEAAAAAGAE
jgi:predicted ATPase